MKDETEKLTSLMVKDKPLMEVQFSITPREMINWFRSAEKFHQAAMDGMARPFKDVVHCAFALLRCRKVCAERGAWGELLLANSKLKERTARCYVHAAQHLMDWVLRDNPKLKDIGQVEKAASEMCFHSPKPFIAIMREAGIFRDYQEADTRAHKIAYHSGNGQQEFAFEPLFMSVVNISKLNQPNFHLILPEGKTEREAYEILKSNLQAALDTVKMHLLKIEPIEA
jgi:hypothetical protein